MNASAREQRDIGLIVDAVSDALKMLLPGMIEKEMRRQLAGQTPKRAGPTREELNAMGEQHRRNLIARGIDPDTFVRDAARRARGMSGAAARRQRR
jgi:hypothetical protein